MKKRIILMIVLSLFISIVYSETWDINKCVKTAIKNNIGLKNKKRELQISQKKVLSAYGDFLPSFSLEGSKVLSESTMETEMPTFELAPIPSTSLMGISGKTTMTTEQDMIPNYQYSFKASQPLFMGGALYYNLKNKKIDRTIKKLETRDKKMNLIYNVSSVYYNLIFTKKMYELTNENIEIVEKHVKMVKNRYDSGEASSLDLLQARVELNKLYPQKIKLKSAYENGKRNLKNIIGIEDNKKINIEEDFKLLNLNLKENYQNLMKMAKKNQPNLQIIQKKKKTLNNTETLLKGSYLPKVLLKGSYGQQKEKWDNSWTENYSLMLSFSWNIFDGLNRETDLATIYTNQKIVDDSYKDIKSKIKTSIKMEFENVKKAKERLKAQKKSLKLSKENLEMANKSYKEGLIPVLDLMKARLSYNNSKSSYIQAKYDINLSILKLMKSIGILDKEEVLK